MPPNRRCHDVPGPLHRPGDYVIEGTPLLFAWPAARRGLPGPLRHDGQGKLRIVTPVPTVGGVVGTAFNQIRQYGRGSVAVTLRLLEVLAA